MDTKRYSTVFFSILLTAVLGAAEPPVKPTAEVPALGFPWAWAIVLPSRELGGNDWQGWVASDQVPRRKGKLRRMPGATVFVTDRFLDEHKERVLELNTTLAPVLARSFQLGWQSSYTSQMLGEFMMMTTANMRPPTAPSVFYNGLVPYWVQQGWESPVEYSTGSSMGRVRVSNTPSDRPIILYPGKR